MEDYIDYSWIVRQLNDGWYHYDSAENAYGPFETEEDAQEGLDDYARDYEWDWNVYLPIN